MSHVSRRRAYSWSLSGAALALLGLWAAACGGGGSHNPVMPPPPPNPNPTEVVVQVRDNSFDPQDVAINPGDTVRWVMAGSAAGHTVTDQGGAFDSGFVFSHAGDSFTHTFTAADDGHTFAYRCTSHYACCRMAGAVRVGAAAPPPPAGY